MSGAGSLAIAREIPECVSCLERWVDPEEHWRWAPLLPSEADLEPGERLADVEPVLAWFCAACWRAECAGEDGRHWTAAVL